MKEILGVHYKSPNAAFERCGRHKFVQKGKS
jgi:hypothetical protein